MFINARPRFVSNGFETFVPIQSAEALQQRLVEMTNNDVNAWSVFRPVAAPGSDIWDQNIDDFGSNENYPVCRYWLRLDTWLTGIVPHSVLRILPRGCVLTPKPGH